MVKYAKQVRWFSYLVIVISILVISVDIIVVTNQAMFNFMPSYGVGMIAGCTGIVASIRGLRATKETSAAIFFRKYKHVSILATFGAIMAMAGVLWLGIIFSIHTVCLVKVESPVHNDSLFLKQTCYNFIDDWTEEDDKQSDIDNENNLIEFMFFSDANIYSGEGSGSGETDIEGSAEGSGQIGIFEDRFSRPALARSYFFTLMTEIVLLVVDFIFLIALAQSAGCCFCCEDNSVQPMESQRSSYLETDDDESSAEESESETDA